MALERRREDSTSSSNAGCSVGLISAHPLTAQHQTKGRKALVEELDPWESYANKHSEQTIVESHRARHRTAHHTHDSFQTTKNVALNCKVFVTQINYNQILELQQKKHKMNCMLADLNLKMNKVCNKLHLASLVEEISPRSLEMWRSEQMGRHCRCKLHSSSCL